jgi:hypothetical protein
MGDEITNEKFGEFHDLLTVTRPVSKRTFFLPDLFSLDQARHRAEFGARRATITEGARVPDSCFVRARRHDSRAIAAE